MAYRIIVVDDDESILELLRLLLESEDYIVDAFDSAPKALRAAVKSPPDAAIVDLMMPEMNGLDLLKALRLNSRTRGVPVLICSAYYESLLKSEKDLAEMNVGRLRKPFHVDELLDTVARMVRGRPRRRAADRGPSGRHGRVASFSAYRLSG